MRTALQEMAGAFTLRTGSSLHLLINRLVLGLVALLLAFSFLNGLSSWLVSVDSVEITMQGNFGPGWRDTMRGAAATNRLEFECMHAILKRVDGRISEVTRSVNGGP